MTASQLYDHMEQRVDKLQKQIKSGIRDQLVMHISLETTQDKMRALQQTIVKEGDRELSDEEVLMLGLDQ
jgi:predicted metalloenzyme YecM